MFEYGIVLESLGCEQDRQNARLQRFLKCCCRDGIATHRHRGLPLPYPQEEGDTWTDSWGYQVPIMPHRQL
jgi:hypothetical protein